MDSNNIFAHSKPDSSNQFAVDEDASRKRKRPEGDDDSPRSTSSQRPRLSPQSRPQSQTGTLPPITNGQTNGAPLTTQEPNAQVSKSAYMNPGENTWQSSRSGMDEGAPETRLMEVLGSRDNSAQPQANGSHNISNLNAQPTPGYPPPSGDHQQSMASQSSLNGALPTLQGVTGTGGQKQRKR